MVDYKLIFLLLSVLTIFLVMTLTLLPAETPKINNQDQAKTYYEYKKAMFLRWNWFLGMAILAFLSATITFLATNNTDNLLEGFWFYLVLGVLVIAIYFNYKTHAVMEGALETLLCYLR